MLPLNRIKACEVFCHLFSIFQNLVYYAKTYLAGMNRVEDTILYSNRYLKK